MPATLSAYVHWAANATTLELALERQAKLLGQRKLVSALIGGDEPAPPPPEVALLIGLMRRHWRTGLSETGRSVSRRAFAEGVRGLLPEVADADLRAAGCGVRAQAIDAQGKLLDDFHIVRSIHTTHVVNAPSPAATASLAIGRHVAAMVIDALDDAG